VSDADDDAACDDRDDPTIADEVNYRVPEHQVLLSFPGDSGAGTFAAWWNAKGAKLWRAYHAKNRRFYE
jgi:hypothetical protein